MNSPARRLAVLVYAAALARAVPVPLPGDQPRSPDTLRQNNPAVLDLRGAWRFDLTHGRMVADGYQPDSFGELASSVQDGHPYEAALDHDPDTRWCASGGELPQWYAVDLGAPTEVTGLDLLWEFDYIRYRFKVEASDDQKAWRTLADLTAEPGIGNGPVKLQAATLRWLRVTIVGVSQAKWASLRELRLTIRRDGKEAAWNPPPSVAPDPREDDRFAAPEFDDGGWRAIKVPANWEIEGFSLPTYWGPDNTVGLYRRWVDVPASFGGQRVYWHFDGVNNGAEVWVNGRLAGYHESGMTAWELDVTDALLPGRRNLLAVRVCKTTPSHDLDTGDYWFLGGIYRETWLAAVPATHVADIQVTTALDGAYRDAVLGVKVALRGRPGASIGLSGRLCDAAGKPVAGVALGGEGALDQDGNGTVALSAPVAAPRLWSAEKPELYYLLLSLTVDGQPGERVEERFGFRQVELKGGVVLWNGVPIKCTGTCRHEEWPNLGKALDEAAWRRDFELLKGCNINAVRTSHYNFAARFMELADEVGIYVLDEVPFCWANTKDPNLAPAFLLRARETLARDRNRPSVLAWSLGNENEPGPNIQKVVDYVAATESSRPRFVSCQAAAAFPGASLDDFHYTGLQQTIDIARNATQKGTPAVFTEQPHIFYVPGALSWDYGVKDLWGQALHDVWQGVWAADGALGSFIWEWQDQSMDDKFPDKSRDIDPETGLRMVAKKGVVDGYRHPKPEYWHVRMVYSPLVVAQRSLEPRDGQANVWVDNRYSFTDLGELTVRWQALADDRELAKGTLKAAGTPRGTACLTVPVSRGAEVVRLEFVHPDGRTVYSCRLAVAGMPEPQPPAPPAAKGTLAVRDTAEALEVAGEQVRAIWDKASGALRSWQVGGVERLAAPWQINLGELRPNGGEHGSGGFVRSAKPPVLRKPSVTATARGASAVVQVSGELGLAESPEKKADWLCTTEVRSDGELRVSYELRWSAADTEAWELGLALPLAPNYRTMRWLRDALWTDYPADHIGRPAGMVKADDLAFRCTHRDLRWLVLGDGTHQVVLLPADVPLHGRTVATEQAVVLFASAAVAPPRDFSTNLLPGYTIGLRKGGVLRGAFGLRWTD